MTAVHTAIPSTELIGLGELSPFFTPQEIDALRNFGHAETRMTLRHWFAEVCDLGWLDVGLRERIPGKFFLPFSKSLLHLTALRKAAGVLPN